MFTVRHVSYTGKTNKFKLTQQTDGNKRKMDVNIALREKLSNLKSPHVLRNHRLPWPIFESNFENWCQVYDEHLKEEIRWDVGVKKHHDSPYWERYRTHETMTMQEFRQRAHNDDKWYTYSYKDIETWPEALREKVDFTALGFEEAKDILFWIGSRGANTPCHYDTYGFNIVVQVFGRFVMTVNSRTNAFYVFDIFTQKTVAAVPPGYTDGHHQSAV